MNEVLLHEVQGMSARQKKLRQLKRILKRRRRKKKSNQEQLPQRLFLSLLPVLTRNYRRRLRHGTAETGYEDRLSPDFLLLSTNEAQFAEKRQGHEGVGPSHREVASDLLQLAQTGLQLSGNVVCKTAQVSSQRANQTIHAISNTVFSNHCAVM